MVTKSNVLFVVLTILDDPLAIIVRRGCCSRSTVIKKQHFQSALLGRWEGVWEGRAYKKEYSMLLAMVTNSRQCDSRYKIYSEFAYGEIKNQHFQNTLLAVRNGSQKRVILNSGPPV